jgi:hydrogenase expression/formation protein HypE
MTHDLLTRVIYPSIYGDSEIPEQGDSAYLDLPPERLCFTTDSYVVDPILFPGGNIGDLAVNGTVNDLAMAGASPAVISLGLILEEGLPMDQFRLVLNSIGRAARFAGVRVVCGDTKVVPRGRGDKIFINTSGIGILPNGIKIHPSGARPGDRVLVSGTVGDHGIAIMSVREGLQFESPVESDTAPLHELVSTLIRAGVTIHALRDPTRGGLASTLVEIAEASGVSIGIREADVPVSDPVAGACEVLGLDPLMAANEGKLVAIVPEFDSEKALRILRSHPLGKHAALIGEVGNGRPGRVTLESLIGGTRVVTRLAGELLPRIC